MFGEPVDVHGFSMKRNAASGCDDCVTGMIRFGSGVAFHGIWDFDSPKAFAQEECFITGDGGQLRFSFYGDKVDWIQNGRKETLKFETPQHIQQPMIESVNDFFLGNAPNPCSVHDGLRVMELIDAFTCKDGAVSVLPGIAN